MTYKNYISILNESRPDIDLFLRYCEDQFTDEFYDEDEDEYIDSAIEPIFEYSATDYLWSADNERELVEVAEAISDNWKEFKKKHSGWDYNRYDVEDCAILIFKKHGMTDAENIDIVIGAFGYIVDSSMRFLVPKVMRKIPDSYLTVSLMRDLNDYFGLEDFIKDKIDDGMTELAEILLTGDTEDDMKEFGKYSALVGVILKKELEAMKDWDLFYEYSWEVGGLIGVERLQYALDKGTYKLDREKFIYFVEQLKNGKDSGQPFRSYGAEAVQEVFSDYDWSDDELNELINDSYILSKIDWETNYAFSNREANRREAEHIASMGPNYRHD